MPCCGSWVHFPAVDADEGSGSLTLEYSEFYDCGNGDRNHQIYMATDEENRPGSVFRMQHCYIHDGNGGNNVKSRAERNEIYYNWIEGAYYHELELIGCDGCPENLKREDSDVVGNVLIKRATKAGNDPDFAVVRFGGDGTGQTWGRYRFVNNTVISGSGAVFRLFDGLESLEVHNSLFYRASGAPNLKRTAEAEWAGSTELIVGSNNWVKTGATHVPEAWTKTIQDSTSIFVAVGSNDLRPQKGSRLINVVNTPTSGPPGHPFPKPLALPLFQPPLRKLEAPGTATARPKVGAIDVGAFEYGTGPPLSDAGGTPIDGNVPEVDGSIPEVDGSIPKVDGSAQNTDSLSPVGDSSTPSTDRSNSGEWRPNDGWSCAVAARPAGGNLMWLLSLLAIFGWLLRRS